MSPRRNRSPRAVQSRREGRRRQAERAAQRAVTDPPEYVRLEQAARELVTRDLASSWILTPRSHRGPETDR